MSLIAANSIYNPFKEAITGASFRPIVAPRSFAAEVDTWRFGTSLDGEFGIPRSDFTWDTAAVYSDNTFVALKNGFFHSDSFSKAVGHHSLTALAWLVVVLPLR